MILPTQRGIGFTLIVVIVYFLAGQTQIGWLYVMVAAGSAWLVLSFLIPLWAICGVRLQRELRTRSSGPATEDEPVIVQLLLAHSGRTTRRFLRLIENCPIAPPDLRYQAIVVPRLAARRWTTLGYEMPGYLRGVYQWPPAILESTGPLGFFRATRGLNEPTRLVVLPPAYAVSASLAGSRAEPAPARRPRRGAGLDIFGTRHYQHGDSLHSVHWRSTARHREIVVREFEEPRQPGLVMWVDNGANFGTGRESSLEYAVKLAASLGAWALRAGYAVLLIDRGGATPCQSALQLRQVLARLPIVAHTAPWATPNEARRAAAGVILHAPGTPGPAPEYPPTIGARVTVGLTGFPDQPVDPAETATVTIGPGRDLPREAAAIVRLLASRGLAGVGGHR